MKSRADCNYLGAKIIVTPFWGPVGNKFDEAEGRPRLLGARELELVGSPSNISLQRQGERLPGSCSTATNVPTLLTDWLKGTAFNSPLLVAEPRVLAGIPWQQNNQQ